MGIGQKTDIFLKAKQAIRIHPEWSDDQVGEFLGLKEPEMLLVREARKDLEAG